jgi:hypothetical protein
VPLRTASHLFNVQYVLWQINLKPSREPFRPVPVLWRK